MGKYIRLLPKRHYIKSANRFSSLAFRNLNGGISIVRELCVSDSGTPLCHHLRTYYLTVDQSPHIIWIFDPEIILSHSAKIEQVDSVTGDNCHYNILGLSDKKARKIFSDHCQSLNDVMICEDDHPRLISISDQKMLDASN
jgi:hypothetical protein